MIVKDINFIKEFAEYCNKNVHCSTNGNALVYDFKDKFLLGNKEYNLLTQCANNNAYYILSLE